MGVFNWYRLFNKTDFETNVVGPSKEASVFLTGIGLKKVLITGGIGVGVTIDDVFIPLQLNGKNPTRYGIRAVFVDQNEDVFWGIYNAD